MEFDFGTIIYIILAVIYFIVQSSAKNKKKRQKTNNGPAPQAQTPKRQTEKRPTFEELLAEFTGQGEAKPEIQPEVVREVKQEEMREERPLKTAFEISQQRTKEKLERAEREAAKIRSSREQFDSYDLEEEGESVSYAAMFSNPTDARKAFIASEIFKRKF